MKKIFTFLVLILLLVIGCSKKNEVQLTTSGKNAFAADVDGSWEVQALTELHGFDQQEKDGNYTASIFYSVDVITSDGKILKSLFTKQVDKKESEKITGVKLEAQFNINGSYPAGRYKLVFNIKDILSNKTLKDTASLKLER